MCVSCQIGGRELEENLQAVPRNYRATPHSTMGFAPATLFLKRAVRNKLPQSTSADKSAEIVQKRDVEQKCEMKCHADRKSKTKPCDLDLGESVILKSHSMRRKLIIRMNPTQ